MTTRKLIADDRELWHAATHHPFLGGVRGGTATNRVLADGGEAQCEKFRRVTKHEQAFWEMAYAGGDV